VSDELTNLERRLEAATTRRVPPEGPLDPEAAALREGWLALSQLLEAAGDCPDFRAAKMGLSPSAEPDFRAAKMGLSPFAEPAPQRRRWRLAAVVALAVSLLVGVALGWHFLGPGPAGDQTASQDEPPIVSPREDAVADAQQPKTIDTATPPPAWEDPLDERIDQARQAVVLLQQDLRHGDDGTDSVYDRLEKIREEIGKNPI